MTFKTRRSLYTISTAPTGRAHCRRRKRQVRNGEPRTPTKALAPPAAEAEADEIEASLVRWLKGDDVGAATEACAALAEAGRAEEAWSAALPALRERAARVPEREERARLLALLEA